MDRRGGRDRGDRHREERRLAARRADGGVHQCSRSRRRLGLGRGSVRREPLAHRARSAGRQAPHPARDVGERGRVRRRRRLGDERDRRRGLPHRPPNERGARRRADGVAARRRCRRRRGVGRRGEPAVARRGAPVPRLLRGLPAPATTRPDSSSSPTSRSRASRVPSRRRSWTACVTSSGSEASSRAGTPSGSSRATRRPLSPADPTSSAAARTRRRTRGTSAWSASSGRYSLALLVRPDPDRERGGRGAAGDAEPVEHVPGADGERGALSLGRAELRPDRGSRPPPGDRARPAREVARRAAGGRPLGARRRLLRQVRRGRRDRGTAARPRRRVPPVRQRGP